LAIILSLTLSSCGEGGGGSGGDSGSGGGGSGGGNGENTLYTVNFFDNGVLLTKFSLKVERGTEIDLPEFSSCYGFEGWKLNGAGALTGGYKVESDVRFDAKFSETVKYISSPKELNSIREDSLSLSGKYRLTNDIPLADYLNGSDWTPIGDAANPFRGCLDGNGFKVTNLYVDVSGSGGNVYAGLFGYIDGGEISNIGVEAVYGVNANNSGGYCYAGIIAAFVRNGAITDSYATGGVTATGRYSFAGGLVGWMRKGSITDSYATGDVTAASTSGNSLAGGLVGYMYDVSSITNSHAAGAVSANSSSNYSSVGGLVGSLYVGSITDSYAAGDVTAASDVYKSYAGGLVGRILVGYMSESSITDTYATGAVTAYYAGGLVGWMDGGSITDSVAANLRIEITQGTGYMGRIVGDIVNGTVANNFALKTISAVGGSFNTTPTNYGEDKDADELKDYATYEGLGWQFGNSGEAIWKMPSGGGYPILYWQ
jgi:hypothetical protein